MPLPVVVIVLGLPGSGKSYFASQFAQSINADHINSDHVRNNMIANKTYSDHEKQSVYNEIFLKIRQSVQQHKNVVADATFYNNALREKIFKEISNLACLCFVELYADEKLIRQRLQQKRVDSDADFKVYEAIRKQWEPLLRPHLRMESTQSNINDLINRASSYIIQNCH
ncbi:MAG: ATP-binding protein [Bacteroidetes bacterium]|nr:ATP-binding protein [Bacteroidota bacterium]MBS1975589.1 ATP-binding protein [Bacteroidota bacterium]